MDMQKLIYRRDRLIIRANRLNKVNENYPSAEYDPEVLRFDNIIDWINLINKKADILKGLPQSMLEKGLSIEVEKLLIDYPEFKVKKSLTLIKKFIKIKINKET